MVIKIWLENSRRSFGESVNYGELESTVVGTQHEAKGAHSPQSRLGLLSAFGWYYEVGFSGRWSVQPTAAGLEEILIGIFAGSSRLDLASSRLFMPRD